MKSTHSALRTLCLVQQNDHLLLGYKKRGFGAGRWNGFGGKLEAGESIETAARRELQEEAMIATEQLEQRGVIDFTFNEFEPLQIHVFSVTKFAGQPQETEEMKPQWFSLNQIPYHKMWPDDQYWLPLFLAGKSFQGKFHFKDSTTIHSQQVQELAPTALSRHIHTYAP